MCYFNLLNWREQRLQVQNRRLYFMIFTSIIISGIIVAVVCLFIQDFINDSREKLQTIQGEVDATVDIINANAATVAQKKRLESKLQLIKSQDHNNNIIAAIVNDLVQVVPEDIALRTLCLNDDILTLDGFGLKDVKLTILIGKLQKLWWVNNAKLLQINNEQSQLGFEIEISVNIVQTNHV